MSVVTLCGISLVTLGGVVTSALFCKNVVLEEFKKPARGGRRRNQLPMTSGIPLRDLRDLSLTSQSSVAAGGDSLVTADFLSLGMTSYGAVDVPGGPGHGKAG